MPPLWSRTTTRRITQALLPALSIAATTACAPLLTGTTDPAQIKSIMESTNARGCIYARVSATPWASATTVIVGTWGDPPPSLEECWKGLPAGIP